MNTKEQTQKIYLQQRDWSGMLDFYEEEISIFQVLLEEVVHEHPDRLSILEHVEEYTAILQKKKQHILELRALMAEIAHLDSANEDKEQQWDALATRIHYFRAEVEALKMNFRRFTAHND